VHSLVFCVVFCRLIFVTVNNKGSTNLGTHENTIILKPLLLVPKLWWNIPIVSFIYQKLIFNYCKMVVYIPAIIDNLASITQTSSSLQHWLEWKHSSSVFIHWKYTNKKIIQNNVSNFVYIWTAIDGVMVSMLASTAVDHAFKLKTLKLVLIPSLLSTQYSGVREKTGLLRFRSMCPSWACWFSAKWTLSSSYRK